VRYLALLRAISNVPMKPLRDALLELGFEDVESYGMSGNLLFSARRSESVRLEKRIAEKLGITTFVRTRPELERVVRRHPHPAAPLSTVLFLARTPAAARRKAFLALDFADPRPALIGRELYYVYPTTIRGRRTPLDLERVLGLKGTFRSTRVVVRLLELMRDEPRGRG